VHHRTDLKLDRDIFPVDPWRLVERGFQPDQLPLTETLLAVANGYLGIRGSLDEQGPSFTPGTFVNGFYETWPINYPETAYGLPLLGQSIVSLPDPTGIALHVDGEPMSLARGRVRSHERVLDMQSGVLERTLEWESPGGTVVRVHTERLVSFVHRHLAAFRFEVEVIEGNGTLMVVSGLTNPHDPARPPRGEESRDPRRARRLAEALVATTVQKADQRAILAYRTRESGQSLACGIDHASRSNIPVTPSSREGDDTIGMEYRMPSHPGAYFRLDKFAVYHTSAEGPSADLITLASSSLDQAVADGFDVIRGRQREYLNRFWERADVCITGADEVQQAVRWNLFQLAQATLRADDRGVPAKGLTGRGYDGHYFWDVEIYVQPFLLYTFPDVTRRLLTFRHAMLDAARRQAETVGEHGALFPWRTISGAEASGYFPTSTAQYHIDADVAYALRHYVEVTGDRAALVEFGAEILVETARLWVSLGFYPLEDGDFHIHGVTGPDEYSAVVDDNTYTNLMARENLRFAVDALAELNARDQQAYRDLVARLEIEDDEPERWQHAADHMFVMFDALRGVHPQDADFLNQEPWDFARTPADHYPLLLHYHPLVLGRHQVIKQADLVLAMFLLGNHFTREQREANFLYYEPITTADSSLSHAVQCIVAADVGRLDTACSHFERALFMDLADWAGNAEDGVHIASTGGVWLALVYGFGGLTDFDGNIAFDPHLPPEWNALEFTLRVRECSLDVCITAEAVALTLREGDRLPVTVRGTPIEVTSTAQTIRLEP
jgi:alpha,alpha-trehalose phosphorylase